MKIFEAELQKGYANLNLRKYSVDLEDLTLHLQVL